MKICSKCKIEKKENEFNKHKRHSDGLQSCCKNCMKIRQQSKEYKLYQKKYQQSLKGKDAKRRGDKKYNYSQKGKESKKRGNKKYAQSIKGKESAKRRTRKYNQTLKGKEKINNRRKYRKKNDICFKLRWDISRDITTALKSQNSSKRGSSILKYLPYTIQELKEHLEKQFESWMSWENHGIVKNNGIKRWNIDHIIPQSKLPYDSMEHPNFQKCWALENLRPLEAIENIKKGNK